MFEQALINSLRQLESAKRRGLLRDFALIGGFAVAAWGYPRATQDFDFAAAIGSSDPQAVAASLGGRYEAGDPDDPLRGVIHLSVGLGHELVPLQLVLFPPALADLIFRHVEPVLLMEHHVPVVSWQVLVLLKLYAGGPQDRIDADHILRARQPQQADLESLQGLAASVDLLEEWKALSRPYLST